jgi:predicted  nucleic acid-binding Zn-ribbon protein
VEGDVHPEVIALLAVQEEDGSIHRLKEGIAQLLPRVQEIAADCERAEQALTQAQQLADAERAKRRDLEERIASHRQLHQRHQAVLNTITSPREAAAAMAQLEQVGRIVADEERELTAFTARIQELDLLTADREQALAAVREAHAAAEAAAAPERARLETELAEVRARREERARGVSRSLLSRYDRIHSRRAGHALHPLRGASCSHCDTVIPLQREREMKGTGATEVCEGCGVLLYAADDPVAMK